MATVIALASRFHGAGSLKDEHIRYGAEDLAILFDAAFPDIACKNHIDENPAGKEARFRLFAESLIRMRQEHARHLPRNPVNRSTLKTNCIRLGRKDLVEAQFAQMLGPGGIYAGKGDADRADVRRFVLQDTSDLIRQGLSMLNTVKTVIDIRFILGKNSHYTDFQAWIGANLDLPAEADLLARINRCLTAARMEPFPPYSQPFPLTVSLSSSARQACRLEG